MAQEIADSTLLDTWASSGLTVEPDISKIIEGWQLGEQPPHEYMNWLQNIFGSKLNHILKNGVPTWNNTTQYLAGSSVQHSGNVWLCKADNTNSEPTDVNANWKIIITIEALENLLTGYVKNTGNQTIAGVKTFSSSPIVPTPTTGIQAVNKNYVDNSALGVGQTWQDVTSSRFGGTTYTNTTGRPIAISITGGGANNNDISLVVSGVIIGTSDTASNLNADSFITAIIPVGATYMCNVYGSIKRWTELR